jgi:hypothetical protein
MTFASCKTAQAARRLGVGYHRLYGLLRDARIPPPPRDSSGHFWWSDADLARARAALAARRAGEGGAP